MVKVAVVTRLVVLVALLQATHPMVAIHLLVTTSGIFSLAALTLLTSAVVALVVAPVVVVLPSLKPPKRSRGIDINTSHATLQH